MSKFQDGDDDDDDDDGDVDGDGIEEEVKIQRKNFFITSTTHFHTVNEIPTNAFNNYILLY
jgi:hypothetical protein